MSSESLFRRGYTEQPGVSGRKAQGLRKRYPKMKPSGVEWLGEVPEHWEVKRGRFTMQVNPPAPKLRALTPEDEVSFVPMDSVGVNGGLTLEQSRTLADISGGYTEFQDGDVVVAKITPCFENGKAALANGLLNGAAYGTTELHVLRAGASLDRSLLFYVAVSDTFRKLGESEMYGAGGQKRVPPEFAMNFRVPLPPIIEQTAIAAYLDRETGRIDALVGKKRDLIERLKEKRTALISRTVTSGLPADLPTNTLARLEQIAGEKLPLNPPLKPSGIEWLGEVPEHWEVVALKHLVAIPIIDGPHETPEKHLEGVPFVSAEAVAKGYIDFDKIWGYISNEDHSRYSRRYAPRKGDIFLVKIGATAGTPAIVDTDVDFNIWVPIAAIRLKPRLTPRLLLHVLRSRNLQDAYRLYWTFGTQQTLGLRTISELRIPLPPEPEQLAIAVYLDEETAKLDALVTKVETAIDRLQEYRTALITAAVTGKIDVT